MSDRDKNVLIAVAAALVVIFLLFFVKPVVFSMFAPATYVVEETSQDISESHSGDTSQEAADPQAGESTDSAADPQAGETPRVETDRQVGGSSQDGYRFRSRKLLTDHFEKHGIDMGFDSASEYEKAASEVVQNPKALHKTEAEDGDDVYYLEATNEFVIVSKDGYIRTYFKPDSGIKYFNKQ